MASVSSNLDHSASFLTEKFVEGVLWIKGYMKIWKKMITHGEDFFVREKYDFPSADGSEKKWKGVCFSF